VLTHHPGMTTRNLAQLQSEMENATIEARGVWA
jgi:hypothetical protein